MNVIELTEGERVRMKGSQLIVMSVQEEADITYVAIEDLTEGQAYEFAVDETTVRQQNPMVTNQVSAAEEFVLDRADVDTLEERR